MTSPRIHPTAIVAKEALIDSDVTVGAYAVIGPKARIKKGTQVGSFCVIENDVSIGEACKVLTGAVIGSVPQDLKYSGEPTAVVIGNHNIIREYVTINLSTSVGHPTRIGDNNLIMAYSHVAHDCVIGNRCVIANGGTLAGHVTLQDRVTVGGLVAIHQFVRLGTMCIVGGCSKVVTDLPPYATCDGHPARFYGLNLIGLKRAGVDAQVVRDLKTAYKIFFQSGLTKPHALQEIRKNVPSSPEVDDVIAFITASTRGLCH